MAEIFKAASIVYKNGEVPEFVGDDPNFVSALDEAARQGDRLAGQPISGGSGVYVRARRTVPLPLPPDEIAKPDSA